MSGPLSSAYLCITPHPGEFGHRLGHSGHSALGRAQRLCENVPSSAEPIVGVLLRIAEPLPLLKDVQVEE